MTDYKYMTDQKISISISPKRALNLLSQREIEQLRATSENRLYEIFRQCALAIFHTGSHSDNAKRLLENYQDFAIDIIQQNRGLRLNIHNAPANACVDGEIIESSRDMIFSALRDVVYSASEIENHQIDLSSSEGITDHVFHLLRNADVLRTGTDPHMVVCWGGHSISDEEYEYTKDVGHQLGLRKLDICTGCGPGAMKGPMKGAAIAHAKQWIKNARYLGLTEPGIIASEAPNPIVNELVILPDIEKRLEAFVRVSHGIIVFPGGAGTAEEILYLLGILLNPANQDLPFPLIFTGPASSKEYFQQLHDFIGLTLGIEAQQRYQVIIDDSSRVAREMVKGIDMVKEFRKQSNDAYYFNWSLTIDQAFQQPFIPIHDNVAALEIHSDLPVHTLALNLRNVFSAIVAGNVKADGIKRIETHGPYKITGEKRIIDAVDKLLLAFVQQQRMKLPGESAYEPCYHLM